MRLSPIGAACTGMSRRSVRIVGGLEVRASDPAVTFEYWPVHSKKGPYSNLAGATGRYSNRQITQLARKLLDQEIDRPDHLPLDRP